MPWCKTAKNHLSLLSSILYSIRCTSCFNIFQFFSFNQVTLQMLIPTLCVYYSLMTMSFFWLILLFCSPSEVSLKEVSLISRKRQSTWAFITIEVVLKLSGSRPKAFSELHFFGQANKKCLTVILSTSDNPPVVAILVLLNTWYFCLLCPVWKIQFAACLLLFSWYASVFFFIDGLMDALIHTWFCSYLYKSYKPLTSYVISIWTGLPHNILLLIYLSFDF